MLTDFRPTHETAHLIHGILYVRDNEEKPWVEYGGGYTSPLGIRTGAVSRPKHAPWFESSPRKILEKLGVTCTDAKRAADLVNLFEGDLAGFYYIEAASPEGSEEALKWLLGAIATYLNENGLSFRDVPRVMPADYLRTFCEYLEAGKFERNFAKDIFAELLKANRFIATFHCDENHDNDGFYHYDVDKKAAVPIASMSWEAYEALVDAGTLDIIDYTEIGKGNKRLHPVYVMSKIIADPRFKAADESEIDAIISKVVEDNPNEVAKARANPRAVSWFVGQIIKASKGKASPQIIQAKLKAIFPS